MNFVKVFYADVSKYYDEKELGARLSEVDDARRERIAHARRAETKAELLGSALIAKKALKEVFGDKEYEIKVDEKGKPFVANAENVYFNVSHTGKYVACACSNVPVGLDIEQIGSQAEAIGVAERFFSSLEKSAIMLSPSPEEAFCRLWTLRESYVKMRGTGFDRGLAPLSCSFPRGVPKMNDRGVLQQDAFFYEIRDIYLCRGAVCTLGESEYSIKKTEV
ncbi:MAG: 4'-phosphopantetheinyl transferase superfamily protein [Clostridia bacterium]|nr:4'-phosphopantetheinyl transferase superfamily protein [Clostridia bacterium]